MSDALSDGEIDETSPQVAVRQTTTPPLPAARIPPRAVRTPPKAAPAPESSPEEPEQTKEEVSRQFHLSTKSKLQKALTEYKLLFTRWKRQPLSFVDEFSIPTWKEQDGNDILRWEFNFATVERTVWHPLFQMMAAELAEAMQEIVAEKFEFANITLGTVDELLERSLAHNRKLRGVLMNVEYPRPASPEKMFIPAEIDLSEFDDVEAASPSRRGRRNGGDVRGGMDQGRRDVSRGSRGVRGASRGPRGASRGQSDLMRGRGDLIRASREEARREALPDPEPRRRVIGSLRPERRRRRDGGEGPYY